MLASTPYLAPYTTLVAFVVSKGLALLRAVVDLVPGHLNARLSMARAFYSTGQAGLAHQTLQARQSTEVESVYDSEPVTAIRVGPILAYS